MVDWWSLGVMMHEMGSAKLPFDDTNWEALQRQVIVQSLLIQLIFFSLADCVPSSAVSFVHQREEHDVSAAWTADQRSQGALLSQSDAARRLLCWTGLESITRTKARCPKSAMNKVDCD